MKTLVSGATGFLGATLSKRLVREGVDIRGIKRPHSNLDLLGSEGSQIEWINADVCDRESLDSALKGISRVYHCAAFLGVNGRPCRRQLMNVNVSGTANMVNASISAGVEKFVHTSSIAALGRRKRSGDCIDETSEWRASPYNSRYGESKYLAELEVQRGIAEGLNATIVNPALVMGVGRSGENTMLLVEKIRDGSIPFMPAGGTNVVDVLDVVDGLLKSMERGGVAERYLLSGENLSWREIMETLAGVFHISAPKRTISPGLFLAIAGLFEVTARLTRKTPLITRESARLSSSTTCYVNEKAIRELGCSFRPFSETAHRIAEAFK